MSVGHTPPIMIHACQHVTVMTDLNVSHRAVARRGGGGLGGHSAGPARPFERCPGCPVNSPDQCHTPACKTRTLASRSEAEQGNVFSGGHPGGHSTGPERPRDHPPCCSGYSSDRLACSPCPNSASYLRLGAGYGGLVDAGEGAKGMVPHVHTHDEHGLNVRYR